MAIRFKHTAAAALLIAGSAGFVLTVTAPTAVRAGQIYDAEIENTIREYGNPIFQAAGLDPMAVRLHIVNSPALNAFVARGQRIFFTTELLMRAEAPDQVIGVLAHETGHIAGGHLARLEGALRDAQTPSIIANILAAAVGVLAQSPGAGVGTAAAGQQAIQRTLLRYTRGQEQSADRAAVRYLETTQQSARGLLEFMRILDDNTALTISRRRQQELSYDLTHPLTRDRIAYMRNHVEQSQYSNKPIPPRLIEAHKRMVAKLHGFLKPPALTLRKYPASDRSIAARYARAVAYFKQSNLKLSLPEINSLIAEEPNNPYFHELKGQILFESGRIADSLAPAQRAAELAPNEPLIRTGLAHVQIELNQPAMLERAGRNLEAAVRTRNDFPPTWRLLATVRGRAGDLGESALASAEYNLLIGRLGDARGMADRAKRLLKTGTPGWLRAEDILQVARARGGDRRDRRR